MELRNFPMDRQSCPLILGSCMYSDLPSSVIIKSLNKFKNVGFEVFTAVVLKSIFFWDMTPCSP
jgi:hypothetical protein